MYLPIPNCKLELNMVKAVISYRYNILHIALYEGNISIKTDNSIQYINTPGYYAIDRFNLKNSIKPETLNLSDTPDRWNAFKNYITVEHSRIIFFPDTSTSKSASEAKLVISKDYK